MSERKGDWIQTASGRQFWPLDPRPEDVDVRDIAHALANLCRFTGHTRSFYSVAEHSVRCSLAAKPEAALLALMHDAGEAYMGDIARPWKRFLRVELPGSGILGRTIKAAEAYLLSVILSGLGVDETPELWGEVERVDELLLVTEARDLMGDLHPEWHHKQSNGYQALPDRIEPWTPRRARAEFLDRYHQLRGI